MTSAEKENTAVERGGQGSGYFGPEHKGRPGEIGGSLPSGAAVSEEGKARRTARPRRPPPALAEGERVVARWTSRGGRDWVELRQDQEGHYHYVASSGGGNLGNLAVSDEGAIAKLQAMIDMGGFQSDMNRTPMAMALGAEAAAGAAPAERQAQEAFDASYNLSRYTEEYQREFESGPEQERNFVMDEAVGVEVAHWAGWGGHDIMKVFAAAYGEAGQEARERQIVEWIRAEGGNEADARPGHVGDPEFPSPLQAAAEALVDQNVRPGTTVGEMQGWYELNQTGRALARWMNRDPERLGAAFGAALEDANWHDRSATVRDEWLRWSPYTPTPPEQRPIPNTITMQTAAVWPTLRVDPSRSLAAHGKKELNRRLRARG